MTHVLRYAARTDRGLLRANNQDSVFAGDRLLVIADGMGGHAAGDVASRLVVAAFVELDELPLGSDMVRPLTDATRHGNDAIAEMVDENPELDGMGTTLTALMFDGPVVALAHVGDSRAYLYRNGVLHQISHDDTFVQSLVDDGRITADEAAHHPQRSLLLRALNGTDMDPSITMRETSPGDRFLICSDGLSDVVSPESIADALAGPDPDQVADTLIQLALVGGGPDNVTVIVADVIETGGPAPHGLPAGGIDPEATGPMQRIKLTREMPRVPLPPIPEDVPAKPEYASFEEGPEPPEDEYHADDFEDDEFDEGAPGYRSGPDSVSTGEFGSDAGAAGASDRRRMVAAPPRRRWARRWAFALALVVLIGVGLAGSYLWASTKYYVGDDGDQVAVFKGVNGSVLGWKFASVQENSCGVSASGCTPLKVDDLVQAARDQVNAGIPVGTLADARAVITRLTSQQLPPCPPSVTATVVGTGTASSASAPASRPSPGITLGSTVATTAPLPTTPRESTVERTTPRGSTVGRTTPAASRSGSAGGTPSLGVTTANRATPVTTVPVTTTVTVTVNPLVPAGSAAGAGQRLRADGLLARLAPATTAKATTARKPATTAKATTARKPATGNTAVVAAPTGAPVTRAGAATVTPTVTVFTTVTSPPLSAGGPTSSGTPLVSPAAEPGITCRLVS